MQVSVFPKITLGEAKHCESRAQAFPRTGLPPSPGTALGTEQGSVRFTMVKSVNSAAG